MFDRDDLIYLAGFIDGEGHISLYYNPNVLRTTFNIQFSVSNTHKGVIDWISDTFNAIRRKPKHPSMDRVRTIFCTSWNRDDARDVLTQLIPYLRMKRRQAEILLHYLDVVYIPNGRLMALTEEQRLLFKSLAEECTVLNRAGEY